MARGKLVKKVLFSSRLIIQVLLFAIFSLLFALPAIRTYQKREVRDSNYHQSINQHYLCNLKAISFIKICIFYHFFYHIDQFWPFLASVEYFLTILIILTIFDRVEPFKSILTFFLSLFRPFHNFGQFWTPKRVQNGEIVKMVKKRSKRSKGHPFASTIGLHPGAPKEA